MLCVKGSIYLTNGSHNGDWYIRKYKRERKKGDRRPVQKKAKSNGKERQILKWLEIIVIMPRSIFISRLTILQLKIPSSVNSFFLRISLLLFPSLSPFLFSLCFDYTHSECIRHRWPHSSNFKMILSKWLRSTL